jgi:hypothetical protein
MPVCVHLNVFSCPVGTVQIKRRVRTSISTTIHDRAYSLYIWYHCIKRYVPTHTHTCTHARIHTYTHALRTLTHILTCAHTYTYMRTLTHTHTHMCAHIHTHVRTHTHACAHLHKHAKIHMHTHSHAHTHIPKYIRRGSELMREVAWVVFDEIHYMQVRLVKLLMTRVAHISGHMH